MTTVTLPSIQSEFDVWNVAQVYWVRVDDWALVGSVDRELALLKLALNQYLDEGPTYRTAVFGIEPPGSRAPLDRYALQLADAHGIEAPDWLAPSLVEIVRRLDTDWQRTRSVPRSADCPRCRETEPCERVQQMVGAD